MRRLTTFTNLRYLLLAVSGVVLIGSVAVYGLYAQKISVATKEKSATSVGGAASPNASADPEIVARLRARGPEALVELFARRDALVEQFSQGPVVPADSPEYQRHQEQLAELDALIDAVGGARYCSASRLYWYTDLEDAKRASAESGKPILSLHMMGKLTDEYSCANSRFFRTTLYSNAEISNYLREHFIMHWHSVRPVPKVTIDFGEGRKLERTLTGNSIHYVLASDGRPIDALPGLYSPAKFLEWLTLSENVARTYMGVASVEYREPYLRDYHAGQADAIRRAWADDLAQVSPEFAASRSRRIEDVLTQGSTNTGTPNGGASGAELQAAAPKFPPRALVAAFLARGKGDVEVPILNAIVMTSEQLETATTDEEMWRKIAALHTGEVRLDEASLEVISRENPVAERAMELAVTKMVVETPLLRMVRQLRSSISLDTVRNEYQLHRRIHEWFAQGEAPADVTALNERVYAELFLTPSSDPWLGLLTPDVYTGLEGAGVITP